MKTFNLKQFRTERNMNQEDFADKVNCSQTLISKAEGGAKKVSNNLLNSIERAFAVDLSEYKTTKKRTVNAPILSSHHNHGLNVTDLEARYVRLLEDKAKIDDKFFELTEKYAALESSLLVENNKLLKKMVANTDKLLERLGEVSNK